MKRDMDLVREILMVVSESSESIQATVFVDEHNDIDKVIYTIDIMNEAGLIKAHVQKAFQRGYISATVYNLTWSGNDFLDNIRSEKIWSQVKKNIAKTAGSVSFSVMQKMAEKIVKEAIINS